MSKGHGKWEQAILEALKCVPAFYLVDLLPDPHTRSQTVALNRAARNLFDAGEIETTHWLFGSPRLSVHRPGDMAPSRDEITRLNVAPGSEDNSCNTQD
jgi:hypothetical protein